MHELASCSNLGVQEPLVILHILNAFHKRCVMLYYVLGSVSEFVYKRGCHLHANTEKSAACFSGVEEVFKQVSTAFLQSKVAFYIVLTLSLPRSES